MNRRNRVIAAAALFTLAGCKQESPAPPSAAGAGAGAANPWVSIPQPDLSKLDKSAQEALRATRTRVETAFRSTQDKAELGLAMGEAGILYHAYDLPDAAAACYVNAQRGRPREFRWPYYLGQLFRQYGILDKAAVEFQRALTLKPDSLPGLLAAGDVLLRGNRPDQARILFDKALADDPRCAAAWYGLGRCDLATGAAALAAEKLETARALDPQATTPYDPLARAYAALGERTLAAECAAAIGPKPPAHSDPLMQELTALKSGKARLEGRAADAFNNRRFDEAVPLFQQVVELNPDDASAHFNLAAALSMGNDVPGAIDEYTRAIQLDPNQAAAHFGLGILLARQGRDAEAVTEYTAAIRNNGKYPGARLNLANALHRLRRFAEADEQYARAMELEPDNVSVQFLRAVTLARLGRHGEARTVVEQGLALKPRDPLLTHALARLLATAPEEVVRDAARALPMAQQEFETYKDINRGQTLAMAYAAVGDWDNAVARQRQIVATAEASRFAPLIQLTREDLARYERHVPCSQPWRTEDPLSYPSPAPSGVPAASQPGAASQSAAASQPANASQPADAPSSRPS